MNIQEPLFLDRQKVIIEARILLSAPGARVRTPVL